MGNGLLTGSNVAFDETLDEEAMDSVLRPALMLVGKDKNVIPVRGPNEFDNCEYKYTFEVEGIWTILVVLR